MIFNFGHEEVVTGTDFRIQKLENEIWVECNYINDQPAWEETAQILNPEMENHFYADWSKIYGSLENGTYRFIKTLYADEEEKEFVCEFTL